MLRDLPYIFVYIDDILVSSRYAAEHEEHLWALLGSFRPPPYQQLNSEHSEVRARPFNCDTSWSHRELGGDIPPPREGRRHQEFSANRHQAGRTVQCLLCMCNFYRRFQPRLAHVVRPLTDSLATTKRESIQITTWRCFVCARRARVSPANSDSTIGIYLLFPNNPY